MNLYLDTSALLKQYFQEVETDEVLRMVTGASSVATSVVSYAETRGALARGQRAGRLSRDGYALALRGFEAEWRTYAKPDATIALIRMAGDLAAKYYLRGLDAIHLASALTLQSELGEPVAFLAYDDRLMAAADGEGLATPAV